MMAISSLLTAFLSLERLSCLLRRCCRRLFLFFFLDIRLRLRLLLTVDSESDSVHVVLSFMHADELEELRDKFVDAEKDALEELRDKFGDGEKGTLD